MQIADNVMVYCAAIDVPALDEAAITARRKTTVHQLVRPQRWPKLAAGIAAALILLVTALNMPAVVAGVERVIRAFTVGADRATPMTVRAVDLQRARRDMPFTVIAPPPIAGAPIVSVDEVYPTGSGRDASVVFEIRGTAPGREIMIEESNASGKHPPALFLLGETPRAIGLPPLHSRRLLRGSFEGRSFTPVSWISHGTRIVLMSAPGVLSNGQLQAIRHAMSRWSRLNNKERRAGGKHLRALKAGLPQ